MRRCWDKKEEHVCKNNLDASSLFATHALRHSAPLILRPAAHSLTRLKSRKRLKDRTWAMPPLAWQTQPCASLTRLKSRKRLKDRTWAMPPLAWQTQPCPSLTRLQSRKQKKRAWEPSRQGCTPAISSLPAGSQPTNGLHWLGEKPGRQSSVWEHGLRCNGVWASSTVGVRHRLRDRSRGPDISQTSLQACAFEFRMFHLRSCLKRLP